MKSLFRLILRALLLLIPVVSYAQTSNAAYTVIASTAETGATVVSTDQTNPYYKGGHIVVNVSAYTSGNYTVTVQGKNPITGAYYDILVSPAISATGTTVLKVYPGIAVVANGSASDTLPKVWRVSLAGAAVPVMTLSVAANLEP